MTFNKIPKSSDTSYNDKNPYLEDALPCPSCNETPFERTIRTPAWSICGIPVNGGSGTALRCNCGNETSFYEKPWEAYRDWNHWAKHVIKQQ